MSQSTINRIVADAGRPALSQKSALKRKVLLDAIAKSCDTAFHALHGVARETEMAKITQTVFVHYDVDKYDTCKYMDWARWTLDRYQITGDNDRIFVGTAEVTFDVPDDFDPRPAQIKTLEAKRTELNAQFAAAVTEINRQISQLQAIEHTEAA